MIHIVDYGAGNLTSVYNALAKVGVDSIITNDPIVIANANRIIFPGVGAAGSSMSRINSLGLDIALKQAISKGTPVLGICVGSQIILDSSEEDGGVDCLGLIPGNAKRFLSQPGLKIPHMGWNTVQYLKEHYIFKGIPDGSEFYYVHSFYPSPLSENNALATTQYAGINFHCILIKNNLISTQFHVEKSGEPGLRLLKNFASWVPEVAC